LVLARREQEREREGATEKESRVSVGQDKKVRRNKRRKIGQNGRK